MTHRTDSISRALGASRSVDLGKTVQSPTDLLALRSTVKERLRSSGGRPTDPAWTISRQVPFNPDYWVNLQRIAEELGDDERKVGAAQVAAILIENAIEKLAAEGRFGLEQQSGSSRRRTNAR